MRFQAIVASCLFVASIVAAQTNPTACQTCIMSFVQGNSDCAGAQYNPSTATDPSGYNADEKKCFCSVMTGLTSNAKCGAADQCGPDFMNALAQAYTTYKDQYCKGFVASKSSAGTLKAAGVTMAIGVAVVQALL